MTEQHQPPRTEYSIAVDYKLVVSDYGNFMIATFSFEFECETRRKNVKERAAVLEEILRFHESA